MPLIADADLKRRLHFFGENQLNDWLKTASPEQSRWVSENCFTASKGSHLVIPSQDGSISDAMIGTSGDAYRDGAIASRLPQGAYVIEG